MAVVIGVLFGALLVGVFAAAAISLTRTRRRERMRNQQRSKEV